MPRAEVFCTQTNSSGQFSGGGVNYVVQANNGAHYMVSVDAQADVVFSKSTDGGFSWSNPTNVFTGTTRALAVWYGRWSGLANDKIYCAYTEDTGSDILFRTIDTGSSDALGTQTTVFGGASTASGGALSICLDRAGNVRVAGSIDAGAEDGAWSSTDDGATWGDTIADPSEGATQDQYFCLPGWNADTSDFMLIFVDASANGLSVKRYDDSGNSWAETAIIADGSFADATAGGSFPHVACAVDIANSRNIIAAWSAVDAANADLRVFIIDDTTITEATTNVVLNSTDDQGLCAFALGVNTGYWYVIYGGKSDGSETFATAINIYYKVSSDGGATWGAETLLSAAARATPWLVCTPRFTTNFVAVYYNDYTNDNLIASVAFPFHASQATVVGNSIGRSSNF